MDLPEGFNSSDKKKGMSFRKKIVMGMGIAIAVFFGIAIVSSAPVTSNDNPQSVNSAAVTSTVTDAPTSIMPIQTEMQQKARVGDLTFEVINATQNARLITVIVLVENNGLDIEVVSWLDFRLIDEQKQLYEDARVFPPDSGELAAMGEIAPSASRAFKYIFKVPEGTDMANCQLVVLEDSRIPKYLDLVSS